MEYAAEFYQTAPDFDPSEPFEVFSVPDLVDGQGFADDDSADNEEFQERMQAYQDWRDSLVEEDRDQYAEEEMCDVDCPDCQTLDESRVDCGYLCLENYRDENLAQHDDLVEIDNRTVPDFESHNQSEPNRFCHALEKDETLDDEVIFEEQSVYEDDV